ncbi:hypothetical protein MLD38_014526 [Melastoma candidum]|uniref:Uncharacterized protein n=1 Tax=Melastoma candidum TaxID=119954 RepID=A0ACB9RD60_9MYRT|nr:hypothetical protein MLD38_014526 [Melastoma candidum]
MLTRLRRALNKIKVLISFKLPGWLRAAPSRERLPSFRDRPGLRACMDRDDDPFSESERSLCPSGGRLQRTTSYSSEDDVDKRAELFIANFYRRLQLERQVSLDLRYCKRNSFR